MYEDIKIDLKPYLGCSKNLIEFFALIGYDEKKLSECPPGDLDIQEDLELSVVSEAKSELSTITNYVNILINQVYPEKPNIIKISKSTKKPPDSNVIFSFCFDNMEGKGKIFYSCYALKYYEKYVDKNNTQYYVPKALLIYSQYPYFTTFYNICSILFDFDEKAYIPKEMLIQIFVNHIPSPIINNIFLVNFQPQIIIPRLTGYPYIDFNLCRIFNLIPINEFIKIYILTFLEVDLLFFSPDLEKLNMTMFIFYILNYPLTDTNYLWHIKSISKEKLDDGDDAMNTSMRGVNTSYSQDIDLCEFKELFTIVDLENKKKKYLNIIKENKESAEVFSLLEYINDILNNKKVTSVFLARYVTSLKDKLSALKKDYDSKYTKNVPFFYVDKKVHEINRKIQELFYDFILNILSILYKDFKYEVSSSTIKTKKFINTKFSNEENIFLKFIRGSIKYNTYFELFVSDFTTSDELRLSLIFTDEFVNLKLNDTQKDIEGDIDYFKIMDNYYSLKPGEIRVSYYYLNKEFQLIKDPEILSKFKKEKTNQLFSFDKNIIENFLIYRKRGLFKSLTEKENKDFNIETNNKITIPFTIINHISQALNSTYCIISSLIYAYSIIFPLFSFNRNILYLKDILRELKKIKYIRFYNNILLKSINLFYEANKEKGQFPELTFNNMKNYCEIIRNNLILENSILPNTEMIFFFRKIIGKNEGENFTQNENNFVFAYEKEENYVKDVKNDIIVKEGNSLIFNYQGKKAVYKFLSFNLIFEKIYSLYDDYSTNLKYNFENLDYNVIYEVVTNLAFYIIQNKDFSICSILINMIIALRKWENDLTIYKGVKNERASNNSNIS